ncbi:CitMHS family transporter [Actinomycetospora sp. CA-084318]|uniref:CitMHS family transporter n=1 Tax=Actinomycetospora sp. CA-084318 TaxID=3239892 RepID=UPI003D971145
MLSALGFATIGLILVLLLTNRVAAVVALVAVPVVTAFVAGFSPSEVGEFVGDGLEGVVGVTAMFVFAIVFFGVMRDAGLFEPVIRRLIGAAGNAPVGVCLATTTLAAVVHLDGAGATTFLIALPAMLPVFDRLGMSRLVLTTCVGLGAGVMNVLPWGGPTARASTVVGIDPVSLWVPLIPAQVVGLLAALAVAGFLGLRESRRLAGTTVATSAVPVGAAAGTTTTVASGSGRTGPTTEGPDRPDDDADEAREEEDLSRPRLFWVNAVLTLAVLATLVSGVAPPETVFLVAAVLALVVNYPGLSVQTARIQAHAQGAMLMATTLLAAGVLLGLLDGTGMVTAMAQTLAAAVPAWLGPALPVVVGVLGVPLSLLFGPDAYYYGVLPVLTELGTNLGIAGVDLARASLVGQETVGFPISPLTGAFYLLIGLGGVDIGRHIRSLIGWAWLVSLVMLATALLTGAVAL